MILLFLLFYKKKQCPINFDRQLGISHFKIQHGIKFCITSLSTFLSRDEHFARFFNNTPRALSVSLFSSAWLCQYFSALLLCVPLPFTAFLAPPLQLDKVNIAESGWAAPRYLQLSTVQIHGPDERALLIHRITTSIRTFCYISAIYHRHNRWNR